jgi:acetoacetate decarboxylase
MKLAEVRREAFAMPLNDPAYPPGPYKFYNREFVVITYRTDPDKLREVVPEPLEVAGDTVAYEFIRMPDSTGFGDYTETGQVIPVRFKTKDGVVQEGGYVHAMYLDDDARRLLAAARSGGSPRNSRAQRLRMRGMWWSAPCTTARCSVSPPQWASSIAKSTRRRC